MTVVVVLWVWYYGTLFTCLLGCVVLMKSPDVRPMTITDAMDLVYRVMAWGILWPYFWFEVYRQWGKRR